MATEEGLRLELSNLGSGRIVISMKQKTQLPRSQSEPLFHIYKKQIFHDTADLVIIFNMPLRERLRTIKFSQKTSVCTLIIISSP